MKISRAPFTEIYFKEKNMFIKFNSLGNYETEDKDILKFLWIEEVKEVKVEEVKKGKKKSLKYNKR